ncbi:RDD family protein [Thalassobellus suaedae]|uniref:RDD family protein n=1 Tax=Thalassobellus suaedae TaxID=3074124 RepID=A0ABY9XSE4_9FLAO|nr:RDD family protein [Flavobacteriaceae bacterium HL-DH14]
MLDNTIQITEDVLASKNMSFVNYIIDLVAQYTIIYSLAYLFFYIGEFTGYYGLADFWNGLSNIEDYIVSYTIMFIYFFLMEAFTFRTLGKYVTKTKVVLDDGTRPNLSRCFKKKFL